MKKQGRVQGRTSPPANLCKLGWRKSVGNSGLELESQLDDGMVQGVVGRGCALEREVRRSVLLGETLQPLWRQSLGVDRHSGRIWATREEAQGALDLWAMPRESPAGALHFCTSCEQSAACPCVELSLRGGGSVPG